MHILSSHYFSGVCVVTALQTTGGQIILTDSVRFYDCRFFRNCRIDYHERLK